MVPLHQGTVRLTPTVLLRPIGAFPCERSALPQVAAWKEAVTRVAKAPTDNATGLPALRRQLRAAAEASPGSASEAAASLDVAFSAPGLGQALLEYASAGGHQQQVGTRGLGLLVCAGGNPDLQSKP